jgi:ABC-type dipeptide/oligopeptide/nickel transport system permease component
MQGTRARLTVPDVAFLLVSLYILRVLWPVLNSGFINNLGELSTATAWLVRLILPLAILMLFSMLWLKATAGVAQ